MKKQIAVIGLGRFGAYLATILHDRGHDVLAIDKDAEKVENIAPKVARAVRTDATNESVLKKLGVGSLDMAVVTMGTSVQNNLMITILLKKLGVRYIVARAGNEIHGEILEKIGADKVVYPERDTAFNIAPILSMRNVMDYIPVANGSGIVKFKAPPYFVGRTLSDLGFGPGSKKEVVVLLIQRGKEAIVNPGVQEVISHVDVLVAAGNDDAVERLFIEAEKLFTIDEKEKLKKEEH